MRLPIVISAGLLMSLALNTPVMSESPIQVAQSTAQSPAKSPTIANSNLAKLRVNRRKWNRQRIFNYRYTFSNSCFCVPEVRGPVVIEVRNGRTYSITSVETGKPVSNPDFFKQYNTVPKLFNVIRDAIARKAYSLDVKYDPKLGYPTQINIDYNSQIADEERYLTIEKLEVIKVK